MHYKWLIVDGNNLLHMDSALGPMRAAKPDLARAQLVRQLEALAGSLADRITVVFDGRGAQTTIEPVSASFEVRYSSSNLTADTVIERLVREGGGGEGVAVVTSDRLERDNVESSGAHSISCRTFGEMLQLERDAAAKASPQNTKPASLGDFFPRPEGR